MSHLFTDVTLCSFGWTVDVMSLREWCSTSPARLYVLCLLLSLCAYLWPRLGAVCLLRCYVYLLPVGWICSKDLLLVFLTSLSRERAKFNTWADVRTSESSSIWMAELFIFAMKKSLIRSSSTFPRAAFDPSSRNLLKKVSKFSLEFCCTESTENDRTLCFLIL